MLQNPSVSLLVTAVVRRLFRQAQGSGVTTLLRPSRRKPRM